MSATVLNDLQTLLDETIARSNIPGAVLAVLHGGEMVEAASGISNLLTGESMTAETLLPFGSVSKVLTATIILRLVERGKIDFDDPVSRHVPEFRPKDAGAAELITIRKLLCHSSGLVSTIFRDTGWGEDAQRRNVELINEHPLYHPPGEMLSYCNSGMLLLGRVIECATGKDWHQAFQCELAHPLELPTLLTRAEAALRYRYSVGHVRSLDEPDWRVAPYPFAFASHSPAGSTPSGRARDLLSIVRMYLGKGEHAGFLSDDIVRQSWSMQCKSPVSFLQTGCGLGWWLFDWENETRVVGHDGSTMATMAFLRIHPPTETAVALLVNSTNGMLAYDQIFATLFPELIGSWEPGVPQSPPGFVADATEHVGAYEDLTGRLDLKLENDALVLTAEPNSHNKMPNSRFGSTILHPYDVDSFYTFGDVSRTLLRFAGEETRLVRPYKICRLNDGTRHLHNGALGFRRVA